MSVFNKSLVLLIVLLAAVLGGMVVLPKVTQMPTNIIAAPPSGGDFLLTMPQSTFELADQRGKIVVMYMGYTYCPDICPTSLAVIGQSVRQLSAEEQAEVVQLFVSVDPERDNPERLAEYAGFFHPDMLGVTGTRNELEALGKLYGAAWHFAESDASGRYAVDHSSNLYVIDRNGELVDVVFHSQRPDTLVLALRRLLDTQEL